METNEKIAQLENEIKVLKNEVQAVLLDLRENVLNAENPFNTSAQPVASQQVIIEHKMNDNNRQPDKVPAGHTASGENTYDRPRTPGINEKAPEPETAREEVEKEWLPESSLPSIELSKCKGKNETHLDLVTMAGLTYWAQETTRHLGKERAEAVLSISEMLGHLPPKVKPILTKLINIEPEINPNNVLARDYLDALIRISLLLGKGSESEAAMLSIISGEDSHR
jgi:hypothetical protein